MAQTAKTKLTIIGVIIAAVIIGLVVWNQQKKAASDELVIGISPSFAKPLQVAAVEAKQQGLNVKLVEFSDWNTPNITLNHGDIDANFFQHHPFLDNAKKETDFKIKAFAKGAATHVGLYSKKIKSFDELKDGAKVVVPNDPVNQGRALLLLQQAKLITLKDPKNHLSNLKDIASNPKNLQFVEVEGPQTARAIDEVDLAFGYPHYLRLAKTADPEQALLFDSNKDNRYAILFAVREDYQDKNDKLKKFVEIYQNSPKVKQALDADFGAKLWFPGWK
ncbi:MetQ/NlpA family ABC transporter substrate-binding protein [Acinetobacter haemolyticus]|jgi:D-methionine transport system substrate-binding protein|uniref:MetQ/NlpA family ABC transporter substrate-binding protein n=1 Tax=unclassified Acinetobacter TaxID=196816 RepID=UPI0015D43C8B|nr:MULTISPECIES: MetQ/NlpA family ABC transporter substrate-binding protein [unclassified Acinetobacter]MDD2946805.1 MetQ/NlpA family ABC transporter substrate-binding protein [Acinetobacter sp.]UDM37372.1 MetQ/NlpA family ABC transporter substrate-binding protein [Acinetobacter haemolyticus]